MAVGEADKIVIGGREFRKGAWYVSKGGTYRRKLIGVYRDGNGTLVCFLPEGWEATQTCYDMAWAAFVADEVIP